ncbi:MAG: DUF2332 domain-containing protein [Ilumatobacteraceae bacterium]
MVAIDELAQRFRDFSGVSTATRAPLYSRLSAAAAEDRDILALLHHAPETQQLPVLLFAAVHFLLLHGDGPELAAFYPNLSTDVPDDDPVPAFRRFVLGHADALGPVIATHNTQTNEVGRCAQFLPALGMLADEVGPLAHVDVGTSAGLNLLLPRYSYEFLPGGRVEPTAGTSTVHLRCETRGDVPVPAMMPAIARSVGLDLAPIDVLDDDAVRWLEACVWPDQADRFARLVAAIGMAREEVPDVRAGDAVGDLAAVVTDATSGLGTGVHPVVTNSWVLNYLPHETRTAYVAALDAIGSQRDLSWVIAEAPDQTPGLPVPTTDPPESITVLSLVRWRDGERITQRLGTTHPHGYWLRWEA